MRKQRTIASITGHSMVDDLFVISKADIREGKRGLYITCTISDATGEMACKIWGVNGQNDRVQIAYDAICDGMVYRLSGQASVYNGELQMSVNEGIEEIVHGPADHAELDAIDFVYSPADCAKNHGDIFRMADAIDRPGLRMLVKHVLQSYDSFFTVPAARGRHHAYRGGLAEHTLEVARYTDAFMSGVEGIVVDRDVALAGALLHDVGKAVCFKEQGFSYYQLPIYSLHGHISPAISIITRAAEDVGVNEQDLSHLLHIVQTHHGEYGDPKPQTVEAWAVHQADNTSAILHEAASDIEDTPEGESRYGSKISSFVYRFPAPEANEPRKPVSKGPGDDPSQMHLDF